MSSPLSIFTALVFGIIAIICLKLFLFNENDNNLSPNSIKNSCFLAAIYEHQRIGDEDLPYNASLAANKNLVIYERVAELASRKGAAIIVFPESSLYKSTNRNILNTVAEEIPKPNNKEPHVNPCNQKKRYKHNSPIIVRTSCLAKWLNIYIVINLSEKQLCSQLDDESPNEDCPKDGHFNYNTDVVIDNNGNLIARYRKYNIFNEEAYHNIPRKPQRVVFDTPFGRLAVFTCFDMVFDKPAIEVVLRDKAQTILYPTRWYDELPFFTAIQAQAAWSYTMNVNMLAANGYLPQVGTIGSGLYAGKKGPIVYKSVTLTNESDSDTVVSRSGSVLMLANMPIDPGSTDCDATLNTMIDVRRHFKISQDGSEELSEEEARNNNHTVYNHMNMEYNKGSLDKDIVLDKIKDSKELCIDSFCCRINYEIKETNFKSISDGGKELILFTRNNVRPGKYKWYEQSCFLATIDKSTSEIAGKKIFSNFGKYQFELLKLEANFDTRYVFEASANNVSTLVRNQNKQFRCSLSALEAPLQQLEINRCSLEINDQNPLNTAGLYGRLYEKDQITR